MQKNGILIPKPKGKKKGQRGLHDSVGIYIGFPIKWVKENLLKIINFKCEIDKYKIEQVKIRAWMQNPNNNLQKIQPIHLHI